MIEVSLSVLEHLELKLSSLFVQGDICSQCWRCPWPRRLWDCRGLTVAHEGICLDCVGALARKWRGWLDWILEPRPIGLLGGME